MKERKFGFLTIFTILLVVVTIIFTKTDVLKNMGLTVNDLKEETVASLLDEIDNGKRCVVFDGIDKKDFNHFIDLVYDSPDLFWVDMQYHALSVGDISILVIGEKYEDIDNKKIEVENKVQKIIKELDLDNLPEYEKVLKIHNWICNNISYDVLKNDGDQDIYGALFSNKARCAGYAELFTKLLAAADVKSEVVSGNAMDSDGTTIAHAWNIVYIDGEAYYFDITWNDSDDKNISYNWFGVTSDEFHMKHYPTQEYGIVETDATKACYYLKHGMYVPDYSSSYIVKQIQMQGKDFTIKCKNQNVLKETIDALSNKEELQKIMRGTGITYIEEILYEEDPSVCCLKVTIK